MKNLVLISLLSIAFGNIQAIAQNPDTLRAKITYDFSHLQDTTNREKLYQEQMVLLLGRNASAYISLDKVRFDEQRKKDIEEQIKNSAPGKMSINIKSSSKKLIDTELYLFIKEKKLISKQKLINNYLIEEEMPVIDWKISLDTLTISGLKCQKALAHFKGRDYTAWFCEDLPFQSGPWKLNGLPGLIVEAYDTNKDVLYKFAGFEKVNNSTNTNLNDENFINGTKLSLKGVSSGELLQAATISLPKNAIKTTAIEFEKLKAIREKDPQAFMNAALAGQGRNIRMNQSQTTNTATVLKTTINNPIELPENK